MVFSSPIFLFGFLPAVLFFYYLSPKTLKNLVLLLFSLAFYAWGEVFYVLIMITSIFSNYVVGLLIHGSSKIRNRPIGTPKTWLSIGLFVNVGLLISFKYANFISDNLNIIFEFIGISQYELTPVHLPLGISFFTFQAISYIVDVYRKEVTPQRKIFDLALYISLFPQLIAGPIVRYHDVSLQITTREHSLTLFASGVRRFIYGLSKKMIIANPLGEVADNIFSLSGSDLTMPLAWIGILAYTLQIYFDFSGYSDMAIGLGRMFGFSFLENFNYPYVSRSLREFWRRWHISLSTWFRDYVYISLGGNRVSATRVYVNLLAVFVLTGFWHGASWNFLIWGLFHGLFLTSEHAGFSRVIEKLWSPIQHIYLLLIVIVGWVFFRAETLPQATDYLISLCDVQNFDTTRLQFIQVLSNEAVIVFFVGVVLATPIYPLLEGIIQKKSGLSSSSSGNVILEYIPKAMILGILFFISVIKISSSTYDPFIYFRF